MFLKKIHTTDENRVMAGRTIEAFAMLPYKLSLKLWTEHIWYLLKQALTKYPEGFKLAIKQTDGRIDADVVIGYENSKPEIFINHNPENILYKIANETAPFSPNIICLYKDADFFAFPDGNPQMTTHDLIVSRNDIMHLGEMNYAQWQKLYGVIENLLKAKRLDDFRIDMNVKNAQAVPQFHLHILAGLFVPGIPGVTQGQDGYPAF